MTSSLRERFGAFRHLPRFIVEVWRTSPVLTFASIVLRLLRALVPIAMLYTGKLIIDAVIAAANHGPAPTGMSGWFSSDAAQGVLFLVIIELALALAGDLLGRGVSLVDVLLNERYVNAMSLRLMDHAAALDLADFENSEQQDRLERARRQVAGRGNLLAQILGLGQNTITIIAFIGGIAFYAPVLVVLVMVALLPGLMGEVHFNAVAYGLNFRKTPERRELDYTRYLGASVETAKEVKLYRLSGYFIERFRALAESLYAANRGLAIRRAVWGGVFSAAATLVYYAAYLIIVWRAASGEITIGALTFLGGSFLRLRSLLETILIGFSDIATQALYLDDLFSFFEQRPSIAKPVAPRAFPEPLKTGFVFRDVGFRYPGTEIWAVRHLDMEIRAGEVVALAGENGAGKSTIVKLLCRLYDPDEGRITLDGVDLRDYDPDALQSHIGIIFQDFVRFDFSAADNIAMGLVEARARQDLIETAASRSLADTIIARLPQGYDQILGRRFADGVNLSGGEWQRIAIARAYMRDAPILVLDEPSAALDARAEHDLFQRFKDLSAGRTAVLISHRFSTIRMADRIIVLDGGRVLEAGTHEQLLALDKRYASLFELQANSYR